MTTGSHTDQAALADQLAAIDEAAEAELTPAQVRYFTRIREAETPLVFNDRARRTLEALETRGLIHVDWDQQAREKGNGLEIVGRNTARYIPAAARRLDKLSANPQTRNEETWITKR